MANTLKLQSEEVTQEVFDRLPALLTAYQVKVVAGLNGHELAALAHAGTIEARRGPTRPGRRRAYNKYTKVSVGKWCGYKI